ncbi:MAG: tRNA preQ1(34) S-adenosylmethionine ribosyltransferase-isomerase QueA [Terriglobales bacterium]
MLVSDFNFDLPPDSIAQEPSADRASSRMLRLDRNTGAWEDRRFRELPGLLRPNDLLVLNNTRVFPARLYGHRSGEHAQPLGPRNPAARDFLQGRVEVLLTRQISEDPNEWECLVRPGRKIGVGEKLYFGESLPDTVRSAGSVELEAEVTERGSFGERRIRFRPVEDFFARIERLGHVPLPPYIDREESPADRQRYQTVYAQARGSVAAPTAGLHFTHETLDAIRGRGIAIAEITLHVGLGTFQPVRVETVEDHRLHRETYEISAEAANAINTAKARGRRVIAVGTTTVRTLEFAVELEHAGHASGLDGELAGRETFLANEKESNANHYARVQPGRGEADIFIYPGYRFRVVDALLTNFHLPQSTLLMLVCALAGREPVLNAYRHAVESGYRFYSYGDCMLIE